ncbi:MAG: hypothetical protein ACRD16_04685 [Thermoanaerobaculia bacterium]
MDGDRLVGPADPQALRDEQKRLRRLRLVVDLTASVLSQETTLTLEEAWTLILRAESAVTALFPGSHRQFDLLIRPRLARIVDERFPPDPSRIN